MGNNAFYSAFGRHRSGCAIDVCEGDTIETVVDGFHVVARIDADPVHGIDDDDCHNPDPSVTGCNPEQQKRLIDARKRYFRGDWWYGGVVLSVARSGVMLKAHAASLWGIEINYPSWDGVNVPNDYLTHVANDLLPEALGVGRRKLEALGVSYPPPRPVGVRRAVIRPKRS